MDIRRKKLLERLVGSIKGYRSFVFKGLLLASFSTSPCQSFAFTALENARVSIFFIKIGQRGACGAFFHRGYLYTAAHCVAGKEQLLLFSSSGDLIGPLDPRQFETDRRYVEGRKQFDQARIAYRLLIGKTIELKSIHEYFTVHTWLPNDGWGVRFSSSEVIPMERNGFGYTFNLQDEKICQGHSGLPVIQKRNSQYHIIGIIVAGVLGSIEKCGELIIMTNIKGFLSR